MHCDCLLFLKIILVINKQYLYLLLLLQLSRPQCLTLAANLIAIYTVCFCISIYLQVETRIICYLIVVFVKSEKGRQQK